MLRSSFGAKYSQVPRLGLRSGHKSWQEWRPFLKGALAPFCDTARGQRIWGLLLVSNFGMLRFLCFGRSAASLHAKIGVAGLFAWASLVYDEPWFAGLEFLTAKPLL